MTVQKSIRILGIDPGSRVTGFGIIDVCGREHFYVASGCIKTPPNAPLAERIAVIARHIREIVQQYRPHQAAVEQVFVNVNPASTLMLGQARGAAVAAKLLVVPGAATVLLATAWAGTFALCRHLLGSSVPFEPVPWWMLTGILTWWVFSAMASMALAMATRSALVSMTVLVAMSTMISPGVLLIKSTDAARFLPDTAAVRLIASPTTLNYDRLVELLSIPMAAAVGAAWAGGCAAVCCWVWMRRDA